MVNIFTDLYYLTFVQELNKSLSTWQPTLLPNSKAQGLCEPHALSSILQTHHPKSPRLVGLDTLHKGSKGRSMYLGTSRFRAGGRRALVLEYEEGESRLGSEQYFWDHKSWPEFEW